MTKGVIRSLGAASANYFVSFRFKSSPISFAFEIKVDLRNHKKLAILPFTCTYINLSMETQVPQPISNF